jgi:hypothetical protein
VAIRKRDEQPERGLPSLNEARLERRRAIVFGRARLPALPPYFWLWLGIGLATFGVVYWRVVQGQLDSRKSAVMAKQRAIAQSLGVRLVPFRDRIERWVIESAGAYGGDTLNPAASLDDIARSPGVYLRLRLSNAHTPVAIRRAAQSSLRDGFTSCLFVTRAPNTALPEQVCQSTNDCGPGSLCNEYRICAPPPEPYNMRLAYRALRVLSSEWTDELHQAGSELGVSAYDRDLDAVTKHDVPVAIELLSRAKYFTLVLDEDAPSEPEGLDAGETRDEQLQRTAHSARVAIWNLSSKLLVLRLRRSASAQIVPVGESTKAMQAALASAQRQANNCSLALQVKDALTGAR